MDLVAASARPESATGPKDAERGADKPLHWLRLHGAHLHNLQKVDVAVPLNRLVADGEFPEPLTVGKKTRLWDWKAVAYYRLRLEMTARLKPVSTAVDRS